MLAQAHRLLRRRVLVFAAVLWLAFPASGWTWGSATHHYIAQHYSQHLPPAIGGLRAYDSVVDQKATDADSRRAYTPGESYRHYIDIDYYPEFLAGTLPHERAALEAAYGAATVLDNGVIPWAVDDVVATLAQQFLARQWEAAATTIADLCHYVGDASQPLHCTRNYDGQLTGNSGIHSRYETTMMSTHIGDLHTPPTAVAYHPSAVDMMFDMITASWAGVSTIIEADELAQRESSGQFNSVYYASLWTSTEGLTRTRIDTATVLTASLVYTAWVNAGSPPVPGSSPTDSTVAGVLLDVGPSPFRGTLNIRFAGSGPLNVDVFDVRGARVARLVQRAPGAGRVSWRPAAYSGRIGPGLYFVRLTGPGRELVRRVTLL